MARANHRVFAIRIVVSALFGALLGTFLGLASAQDTAAGWLDPECARQCSANGYDAEFCGQVCWVPDPAKSAEADNLDWKCMTACGDRGGRARACMASCRRY